MRLSRAQVWLLYGLIVLVGVGVIAVHTVCTYAPFTVTMGGWHWGIFDGDKIGYVAAECLPPNHLFIDGDLRRPALSSSVFVEVPQVKGRYTTGRVRRGEVVRLADTASTPRIILADGRSAIRVACAAELVAARTIDAGSSVRIVYDGKSIEGRVEAIIPKEPPSAVVSVSVADAAAYARTDAKHVALIPLRSKGAYMDQKTWNNVLKTPIEVKPSGGPWVRVLDYVPVGTLLRFECKDPAATWSYSPNSTATCGPNGDAKATVATGDTLPLPTAPVGSLIAKLGGSAAANDGAIFCVGGFAVHRVGESEAGPLYLGMNAPASKLPELRTGVAVSVAEATP